MIHRLSAFCARNIILLGNLHHVSEPILRYGCELIITSIIGLQILIILSLIIGHPSAWIFFIISFAPHRTFAGGYHADTHTKCFFVTSMMFVLSTITAYGLVWTNYVYLIISLFSMVLIFFFAPLPAENKPLSPKRFRSNRIKSLIIICANCLIAVFFTMLKSVSKEANMYFAGIFFASSSLIMGKIKIYMKGSKTI